MPSRIELPQTFLDMPRWWHEGEDWLKSLPDIVETICHRWQLDVDGPVMYGSNAIVVPVHRGDARFALRVSLPDARTRDEMRALGFWDGRGTVQLHDIDPELGASLLERLDACRSLGGLPLAEAVPIIARSMRRLAIPAPPDVRSTAVIAGQRAETLVHDWKQLGRPIDRTILDAAVAAANDLSTTTSDLAVNGDLHFEQVLAGDREPWLVVDPLLLRGDIEYDLARILWSRLDEMPTNRDVLYWFDVIVAEAALDRDRARAWVMFRSVDYWLWGLANGLTEDPVRCARIARIFR